MTVNDKISDYITFPKTFENYKWYKPILVFILSTVILFILGVIIFLFFNLVVGTDFVQAVFQGGYEALNSPLGILFSDLMIIMFIPSIYIASRIVKDRPFSSYSSSRGGWNFKLFFKVLLIPIILTLIYEGIRVLIKGPQGTYNLSIEFIIVILIAVPLQSIAEEYLFRGLVMQTLGSWFKIPVLAVVIQAIIFALAHGYNSAGLLEMVCIGLICGFFAWKTNGLEVSSAIHVANNFVFGLFVMLGLQKSTSSPDILSVGPVIIFSLILTAVLYYVGKKTDWFGEIPQDSQDI